MDFKKYSQELEKVFEILRKKDERYDPRNWEKLWSGYSARWVFKFLAQAMVASADSTCLNRHTGACLVDIKRQQNGDSAPFAVASCFNGAPTGITSCTVSRRCHYKELAMQEFRKKYPGTEELSNALRQEFSEYKKRFFQFCLACHAEFNAICFSQTSSFGKLLFATTDPCPECAKTIVQHGIGAVVYAVPYKVNEKGPQMAEQSRYLLQEAAIPCVNINIPQEYFYWLTESIKNAGQPIVDMIHDPF